MSNKHRPNYYNDYRHKIVEEAIQAYGDKCSCQHCILPKGHKPLMLVLQKKFNISKGQFSIASFLKKNGFKKSWAKLLCLNCRTGDCNHTYKRQEVEVKVKDRTSFIMLTAKEKEDLRKGNIPKSIIYKLEE